MASRRSRVMPHASCARRGRRQPPGAPDRNRTAPSRSRRREALSRSRALHAARGKWETRPAVTDDRDLKRALYDQVSESYHKVDDFRMKLLGLLPLASGTGVFVLLNDKTSATAESAPLTSREAFLAIGVFGMAFTAGLFAYELYGIKRCHYLIATGACLERELGIAGQFRSRPRELAWVINEPFASAIIYPASMAAWAYLAVALRWDDWATVAALAIFVTGLVGTLVGIRRMAMNEERERLLREAVPSGGLTEQQALERVEALRNERRALRTRDAADRLVAQGALRRVSGSLYPAEHEPAPDGTGAVKAVKAEVEVP